MCTSRDKMAASGMEFTVLIECEFVAVVSWKVGWLWFFLHKICTRPIGRLVSQIYSSLGCFNPSGMTGRVVSSNTVITKKWSQLSICFQKQWNLNTNVITRDIHTSVCILGIRLRWLSNVKPCIIIIGLRELCWCSMVTLMNLIMSLTPGQWGEVQYG